MKDDLSIIVENLISSKTKLLYANKRRQLKGLAPMTPEEEREYKDAYIILRPNTGHQWEAYDNPNNNINDDKPIAANVHRSVLVYHLIKKGFNNITEIEYSYGKEIMRRYSREMIEFLYSEGEKKLAQINYFKNER